MTRNGVELHGIRYRHQALVSRFLDNNYHREKLRKASSYRNVSVDCRAKRNDGDLSTIQVYDPVEEAWITLPSTQQDYTYKLSAWEHQEFGRLAKRRNEAFCTEEQRLRSRKITLDKIAELVPNLKFQQRKALAGLFISDQVRKLGGTSIPAKLPEHLVPYIAQQEVPDTGRLDSGLTPTARRSKNAASAAVNQIAPEAILDGTSGIEDDFDWDALDSDYDPETGIDLAAPFSVQGFDISGDDR